MAAWGRLEHQAERWSTWLLLADGAGAGWYLFAFRWVWLPYLVAVVTIITVVIHLWARFAHVMEKRQYQGRRR